MFPQRNPLCQRMACDHPLKGARREGHFDMGMGPCKAPGCQCNAFVHTDPSLLLDMRGPRVPQPHFDATPVRYQPIPGQFEPSPDGDRRPQTT